MKSKTLAQLRIEIDKIDHRLIDQLAKRIAKVKTIGELKIQQNLPPLDQKRFEQLLEERTKYASTKGVDKEVVVGIFKLIHKKAVKLEKEMVKAHKIVRA